MATLSLTLLGKFQARLDDRTITSFQTRKVQALLIYLATEPEQHQRESLLELMWPGMPERSARHNLRQVLYYLRGEIPDLSPNQGTGDEKVPLLLANRQMIQLNPEATVRVDARRFESLVNGVQGHEHINILSCETCLTDLEKAVELYRGDFLVDFYLDDSNVFEEWAQVSREAYRRKALDALDLLTTAATRQGEHPKAQALAKRQLEIDNLRENAYRQLMEALALAGHREEALAVYDSCRRLLAEELSMAPSKRTTEIADKIQAGDLSFDTALTQGVRGYELKEEIGVGAFGAIHRAYQTAVDREVAVKVIHSRYANDPEFIRRFEEEAQTIARLEHPYIVPLYDYWRDPDGAYLVMRYLRGGSLLTALEKNLWDVEPASRMLEQIALALSAAHHQGVIHRDIKPANILLDEAGNAYLSDFGIAKALDVNRHLTAPGAILGTPDYISPEQILNEGIGPESDIYSLGAVLFETLTGEKPFSDSSLANLIYKQLNNPFPLVSASRPDLPAQIDAVIQKATAKRPADRYKDALEMAEAFRRAWRGDVTTEITSIPLGIPAGAALYNPYKGLQAFQEADADDFFGRNVLIDRLLKRLTPEQARRFDGRGIEGEEYEWDRFLALVGPSGSGKSSVVKAGLLPALRSRAIPGSDKWFFAEMVPGTHPLEELEMALWPVAVDAPPSLVEPMQRDVRGMLRTIRRILPEANEGQGSQLLLFIDQFEELFTLVDDEERRNFFLDSLLAAISAPRSPLRVVITLRADFYDRPLQYQALGRLLKACTEIVLPMTPEELTWTVREPARRMGVGLEEGLAEVIVADVADQPGSLPLMQYALTELFERRQDSLMTQKAYQEIGGVLGALGGRAEKLYGGLSAAKQEAARQLFLRLVTLGEGAEDTRRRVLRSELEALRNQQLHTNVEQITAAEGRQPATGNQLPTTNRQSPIPDPKSDISIVIDAFGSARLLTFDRDPITRGATVEVAHEALLREWSRLRSWLDESRDDIRLQQKLARASVEWLAAGKDDSYLLHGARLAQLEGWSEATGIALTRDESAFLAASIGAREDRQAIEEARRRQELETARKLAETEKARAETEARRAEEQTEAAQQLRRRAFFLVGALAIAALLAVAAVISGSQAIQNADQAEANLVLAVSREAEAITNANAAATQQALAQQNADLAATREVEAQENLQLAATRQVEVEAEALARATAEAEALASAAEAQNVAIIAGSQAALAKDDSDSALALAWQAVSLNPESAQAQAQLSEVAYYPGTIRRFTGHTKSPLGIAISPDGSTMLSAGEDQILIQWDLSSGEMVRRFEGHTGSVNKVAISPNGETAVSVSDDGLAILWDLGNGQIIRQFSNYDGLLKAVAISPDGQSVAVGGRGDDPVLIQWDINTGREIRRYESDESGVQGVAFTPDGLAVLSASNAGIVRLWDVQTGELIREMVSEVGTSAGTLRTVAISPDGLSAMTGFANAGMFLWDLETGELIRRYPVEGGAPAILFHPDNRKVVVGNDTNIIMTVDLETGEVMHTYAGHNGSVYYLAITPDGRKVVSASLDNTLRLWDLEPGQLISRLTGPGKALSFEVDLSPDERTALSGSFDGSVRMWDLETGEVVHHFVDEQQVLAVRYAPDGETALIGTGYRFAEKDEPGRVILWDVATGEEIRRFIGHPYAVVDAEFSPDGKQMVSSGAGAVIILWDVATGQEIWRFEDYFVDLWWPTEAFWDVAFSPDGRTVLASHASGPLIVIDAETGEEIDQLIGHIDIGAIGITFSADGRRAVSGGADTQAILWDMETRDIVRRFTDHVGIVGQLTFSPDESLMLGGSSDGLTTLWDVETGEVIRRYGNGFVQKPIFSADGSQALAGFRDGTLELWRMDTTLDELLAWTQANRYIPDLTCEQRSFYKVEPLCESEG